MASWLKRLLGGASVPPSPPDPWDRSAQAVAAFGGSEAAQAMSAIRAADAKTVEDVAAGFGVDVVSPEYLLQCVTRDLLIVYAGMTYLDWKSGLEDAEWGLEEQFKHHSLAPLTGDEKVMLEAVEPIDTQIVTFVTFPDLYHPFDTLAQRRGRRVLAYDEHADSYAFLVVTPDQFDRWAGVKLSLGHEFFTDMSFEKGKTE